MRLLRRICVGDVAAAGRKALAAKRLSNRGDNGNESTADFDLVAKKDVAFENDEHTVRRRATLIDLKAGRPDGFRSVSADGRDFFGSEARAFHSGLVILHQHRRSVLDGSDANA